MENNKKVALFIDCENISVKYIEDIINNLAKYGEVNIRKAYGDWKNKSLNGWDNELFNYSLEPIHQPPYNQSKNASDIKMTVDIMKTLYQRNSIEYIALATSDSDFTPLVTEVKSQGIQVIGFGESKTNKVLQKACSIFIEVGQTNKTNKYDILKDTKLVNRLKYAINVNKNDDDYALVSEIGTYCKNSYSVGSQKYGGYKTWGDIFKALDDKFEITLRGSNGHKNIMLVRIKKG